MSAHPHRLYLLTGVAQGVIFSWGLAAVVWWVVELELSPLRLVLLGSALELTILLAEVPTGVIADVWSRKWSVCLAYAVMGAAMMLAPVTSFFPALLGWQVLFGIGWTMQSGAATAWVTDESDRSADTLIVTHAKWRVIGLMGGLPITAAIGVWSVVAAMVVVGSLSLAAAIYLAKTMTETRAFATGEPAVPATPAQSAIPADTTPTPAGGLRTRIWPAAVSTARAGARRVRHQRVLLVVLISTAFFGAANQAVDGLDTIRVTDLGLPEASGAEAVLFIGAVWYVMNALQLPLVAWLGRHVDSMSARRSVGLLMFLLGLSCVGVLGLALGPWLALAIGGWTLREVTTELSFPLAETLVNRQTDSSVRATVISFLGQAESLGQVVGGTALGVVAQLATVPIALAIASALLGVASLVYLFAWGSSGEAGGTSGADGTGERPNQAT